VRRIGLSLALIALLLGAPAAAATELTPFPHGSLFTDGTGARGIDSDGFRYLIWRQAESGYRIYDEQTDAVSDVTVPSGCRLVDTTVGLALFTCPGADSLDPHVLFLRSRTFVPARRRDDLTGHRYSAIGRHWIAGQYTSSTSGKLVNVYLNWRTGQLRSKLSDFDTTRDLDDPKLRPLNTGGSRLFAREGPFVARTKKRPDGSSRLFLEKGREPRLLLSRCAAGCARVDLTARLVTWSGAEGVAGAYDAVSSHHFVWRFAQMTLAPAIVHTRRHVLIGPNPANPDPPALLWARIRK
jgi:hypothetical protein